MALGLLRTPIEPARFCLIALAKVAQPTEDLEIVLVVATTTRDRPDVVYL